MCKYAYLSSDLQQTLDVWMHKWLLWLWTLNADAGHDSGEIDTLLLAILLGAHNTNPLQTLFPVRLSDSAI